MIAISTLMPEPYRTHLIRVATMQFIDRASARRATLIDGIRRDAAKAYPSLFVGAGEEREQCYATEVEK